MPIPDIKAPVGQKDRITKPDPKQKNQKFKPVANRPEDVEAVQFMLVANGYDVEIDGKCGAGTIAAIKAFQKSALGYKKPDGIVDPGDKTWDKGLSAIKARIKADEAELAKRRFVMVRGKEVMVYASDLERQEAELKQKVIDKAKVLYNRADVWDEIGMAAEKTIAGAEGLTRTLDAIFEVTRQVVSGNAKAPFAEIRAAREAATALKIAADRSTVDWEVVRKRDAEATKAINAAAKAFRKWTDDRDIANDRIKVTLEVVQEVSFTAVEAFMTVRFVAQGKTPIQAAALAAMSCTAMKSTAGELGEYAGGKEMNAEAIAASTKKVLADTALAGASTVAGGKISSGLARKLGPKLAAGLTRYIKSPGGEKAATYFAETFVEMEAFDSIVNDIVKETIVTGKEVLADGKGLTADKAAEKIAKVLTANLLKYGPTAAFVKFANGAPKRAGEVVEEVMVPMAARKLARGFEARYGKEAVQRMLDDDDRIFHTLTVQLSKGTMDKAIETYIFPPNDSVVGKNQAELDAAAEKALAASSGVNAALEAEIARLMEARLKAAT